MYMSELTVESDQIRLTKVSKSGGKGLFFMYCFVFVFISKETLILFVLMTA